MRVLHTSDWHVGRTIRGRSRTDEHAAVLAEIAGLADAHEVDLVVVAGDLFDTASPTPDAEQLVYRALLDLAGTGATVAIVAGNHDNPRRLHAVAPLLALGRVLVVAEPTRPDDGGVRRVAGRSGEELELAFLPFVSQRGIVRADALMEADAHEHLGAYEDRLRAVVAALCGGFDPALATLVVAHAYVRGGAAGGGERLAHLTDDYGIGAGAFPASVGYVALGHLHRAQRLAGPTAVHYCGSPLQLDFGEEDEVKQVNLVELEPGVPARVTPLRLTAGRPLRTVRGSFEQVLVDAVAVAGDPWLRLVVREAPRPGLADELRERLGDAVVEVRLEDPEIAPVRPVTSRRGRSPQELFADFLAERGVQDPRLGALFTELLEAAEGP